MIDAKDLMIGNWLYDKVLEKPIQINNLPYGLDLSNREGIEVTEKLLEKIGFEERILGKGVKGGEDWVDYIFRPEPYKLEVCDHGGYVCDKRWHVHIDNAEFETLGGGYFTYLHELMNLVRVISGYELKITKDMLYD